MICREGLLEIVSFCDGGKCQRDFHQHPFFCCLYAPIAESGKASIWCPSLRLSVCVPCLPGHLVNSVNVYSVSLTRGQHADSGACCGTDTDTDIY